MPTLRCLLLLLLLLLLWLLLLVVVVSGGPFGRGFETVTYMLKGIMEHEDFCGHR